MCQHKFRSADRIYMNSKVEKTPVTNGNRRKKLLINPEFQLRFMKNIVVLNVIVCAVFYAANYYFFWRTNNLGRDIGLEEGHVFFKFMEEQQRLMAMVFTGTATLVTGILLIFGLVYSHRIVGPMYHLKKYLAERGAGKIRHTLGFREKDYFQDVADSVNAYLDIKEKDNKPVTTNRKKAA